MVFAAPGRPLNNLFGINILLPLFVCCYITLLTAVFIADRGRQTERHSRRTTREIRENRIVNQLHRDETFTKIINKLTPFSDTIIPFVNSWLFNGP